MALKKIDTNKYLEFLEFRDRIDEVFTNVAKKVLNNPNWNLKDAIGRKHVLEYKENK